jgi:hypothetical protein
MRAVGLVATLLLAACGPTARPAASMEKSSSDRASPRAVPLAASAAPAGAPADSAPTTTSVAILDPAELLELEHGAFGLGRLVAGAEARTTRELTALAPMRDVLGTLKTDVRQAARPFPLARVTSIDGFRLFDEKWLDSNEMTFTLSGVFNRLDRRPFYEGTCGEVRFLYRLVYATEQGGAKMTSRLPMTLNVVFLVGAEGDATCRAAARAWQAPADLEGKAVANWLVERGALSEPSRKRWRLKSVESNLQTFRLQSSVHPTLAGHIEYGLRVFHPKDDARTGFAPAAMENMPDVPALAKNLALRAELLAHLKQAAVLSDVDRGTLQLPDRFLAKQATSYSPRGLSRVHNRPFRELFREQDFADVALSPYRTIKSPGALLRRLDGASCTGCHQSRSIAGFHHVGRDAADTPAFNSLFDGSSSHLRAELERRKAYVESVAAGATPDEFRPVPEKQGVGNGEGAPCGLGDPGFADWTCKDGFRCTKLEDTEVGVCLAEGAIGAPCEYGTMLPNARPHRDRIGDLTKYACGAAQTCDTNFSGFPEGACSAACSSRIAGSSCADFLDVDGFQNCLRSRGTFDACAARFVFGAGLPTCDAEHACRQDYVCARTRTHGVGACVPPYFVYQLRLDGYPLKH